MSAPLPPDDTVTLREARDWLRERVEHGARCPCCTQLAKVYKRKLNRTNARLLIEAYRRFGLDFFHAPSGIGSTFSGGEWARLAYFDLIAEADVEREDGGRAGYWRVTEHGREWLADEVRLPSHARIYDGRLLGLTGDPVSISDALGYLFDLRDLMAQ